MLGPETTAYYVQTGEQVCLLWAKHKHRDSSLEIHRTGVKGLQGLWLRVPMTKQHPGAPRLKTMGPSVQETLTQPVLFSILPLALHLSRYLSCSFVLSLTGREQGMLIKGCENQEKRRARWDSEGKIAGKECCASQWIGNTVEIERWALWQKQLTGNKRLSKKTCTEREMKNICTLTYSMHGTMPTYFYWVGGGFPEVCSGINGIIQELKNEVKSLMTCVYNKATLTCCPCPLI